jgi:hypothetical protein
VTDSADPDGTDDPGENSNAVPAGYTRVPIADWAALERHLRAIGGAVETTDEAIRMESGNAHVTVTREGDVDTGMPLHAFEREGVTALYVDTDRGRIRVYGPDGLAYEFRNP